MKIHDNIRMMRENKNWSQEKMAEQLHMSANGYAKIERGETKLHIDKLQQIANVLDVDIFDLMTLSERGVVFCVNGNSNNNANYYASDSSITYELEKLKLVIAHKDELLAQKDNEIRLLNKLLAVLKAKN